MKYKLSLVIYSIILVGQLLLALIWSMGMRENAEFNLRQIIVTSLIFLTIITLSLFPYLAKKGEILKKSIGLMSIILILVTLIYGLKFLLKFDWTGLLIIIITLYSISGISLIAIMGKEIIVK